MGRVRRCACPEPHTTELTMYYFSLNHHHDAGNHVCNYAIPIPPTPTRTGHLHYLIRHWYQAVCLRHAIGPVLMLYACWVRPRPFSMRPRPCVVISPLGCGRDPSLSEIAGSCCVPGCCHCHCPALAYPVSTFSSTLSTGRSTFYSRANPSERTDRWLGGGAYV